MTDVGEITQLVNSIITAHDLFQDGVMAFLVAIGVVNSVALYIHLRDHKRWRLEEGAAQRGIDRK